MTCGIYRITEKETGRHYIGQSKNIESRWSRHRKRFPPELFSYHIVITCVPEGEVLDCLEKFCIADFKAKLLGFNVTRGGNRAWGWKNKEATRKKIGDIQRGIPKGPQSEEHRKNQSLSKKKLPFTTCPHCNLQSQNKTCMIRWHFDNCKARKD